MSQDAKQTPFDLDTARWVLRKIWRDYKHGSTEARAHHSVSRAQEEYEQWAETHGEALIAAIERVEAQCRAWIDEYEAERVRGEQWFAQCGETWYNPYENQRDNAEAILTAIKGGAA